MRDAEDADAEHDDNGCGKLAAHAHVVAEEDDQGGDHDIGDERHDEHALVEDPLEPGAQGAEDRVEGGDQRDGQVGLQPSGSGGLEHQPEHEPHDQGERGDHGWASWRAGTVAAARSRRPAV
jgi:hypothetical protein